MEFNYDGTAAPELMEPLLRLAALPTGLRLAANGSGGFSGSAGASESVTLAPEETAIRMTWRDGAGAIVSETSMRMWGDGSSEEMWFPFNVLPGDEDEFLEEESIELTETIERARELLARVSFVDDKSATVAMTDEAVAAVNYMRLRSHVTAPWHFSLAYPFELSFTGMSFDEGDLMCELGALPPGLDEVGECALVQADSAGGSWSVSPLTCLFDKPLSHSAEAVEAARAELLDLGFFAGEIDQLDLLAAEVSQAFASTAPLAA